MRRHELRDRDRSGTSEPAGACRTDDGARRVAGASIVGRDRSSSLAGRSRWFAVRPRRARRRRAPPRRRAGADRHRRRARAARPSIARSPPPARSPRGARCRSASRARAAWSRACWSSPASGSRAGQVLATVDRSVQAQTAAALAAQVQVARADADARAGRARPRAGSWSSAASSPRPISSAAPPTRDAAAARVKVAQAHAAPRQRARNGRLDIRAPAAGPGADPPGRARPDRQLGLGRAVPHGRRAARWRCARSWPRADLAGLRAGARATVTPVGTDAELRRRGVAGVAGHRSADAPGHRAHRAALRSRAAPRRLRRARPSSAAQRSRRCCPIRRCRATTRAISSMSSTPTTRSCAATSSSARCPTPGVAIADGPDGTERVVLSAGAFLSTRPEGQAGR